MQVSSVEEIELSALWEADELAERLGQESSVVVLQGKTDMIPEVHWSQDCVKQSNESSRWNSLRKRLHVGCYGAVRLAPRPSHVWPGASKRLAKLTCTLV